MRSQFINYVTGASFLRDERQRLSGVAAYRFLLESEVRASTKDPFIDPLSLAARGFPVGMSPRPIRYHPGSGSVWDRLKSNSQLAPLLPHQFVVRLPLGLCAREPDAATVHKGDWKSMSLRVLVNALGVVANLRFGFDGLDREVAVNWPGEDRWFAVRGSENRAVWRGGPVALCGLVVSCVLDSMAGQQTHPGPGDWDRRLSPGLRRIYTELQAEPPRIPVRLMYGLAKGKPGWQTVDRARIRRAFWFRGLNEAEQQCFVRSGAALALMGQPFEVWRAANCHRRNIVYSLALHAQFTDYLEIVRSELSASSDAPKPELKAILHDDTSGRLTRYRFTALALLQDAEQWLRYYSDRREVTEQLSKIPAEHQDRIASRADRERLMSQRLSREGPVG